MTEQDKLARRIDDLRQTLPAMYAIAEQARRTIHAAVPDATERGMHGERKRTPIIMVEKDGCPFSPSASSNG
jgi:hypothetical protein